MNLTVKQRLFGGFGLAVISLAALAGLFMNTGMKLGSLQDRGALRAKGAVAAKTAAGCLDGMYAVVADLEINRDIPASEREWLQVKTSNAAMLADLSSNAVTPGEKQRAQMAMAGFNEFVQVFETQMLPACRKTKGITAEIRALDAKFFGIRQRWTEPMAKYSEALASESEAGDSEFDSVRETALNTGMTVSVIAILSLSMLSLWLAKTITSHIANLGKAADKMALGDVNTRVDPEAKDEIGKLAMSMNAMAINIQACARAAQRIAAGDLTVEIKAASEDDVLAKSMIQMVDTLRGLIAESGRLRTAAVEGRLEIRGDATQFEGGYRDIVQGVNDTLDALIGPINESAGVLERLAANDLTARMEGDYQGGHAKIKESLNTAMDTLQAAMQQVAQASDKVASSAQSLSSSSEEVGKASQQVAETIGQVAADSQEQSRTVQSSASAMEQLTRAISEIATGAQSQAKTVEETVALVQQSAAAVEQVAKLSQDATENGRQVAEVALAGGRQVEDAVGSMGKIKDATDQVAAMVKQLGQSSQQIGAIVETIDDIAEQTNLLALNAAIEAARAGEHGKGFAVVADEVRKLAERSSKATGEIAALITSIQNMTAGAVEAMDRGSKQVEEGAELGNQAGDALGKIQGAVHGIVSQIEDMSGAAQQMAASSAEVIKAIENVSTITEETRAAAEEMSASSTEIVQQIEQVAALSEENATAAEEVSATTEEQNAAVEEMAAASEELAEMAGELQELVSQFKTDDGATTTLRMTAGGRAARNLRKAA